MTGRHPLPTKLIFLTLILVPYLAYIVFIIQADRGPIDYETFMGIGRRLLTAQPVYGENSYYPMPYVMIFAFFSWLPRALSMALWLVIPVIAALIISRWNPLVLLFAPLFGHFVGGQSAVFGMVGLWGYRKHIHPDDLIGGIFLGLTMIKPQLGILPLLYAFSVWIKEFRLSKKVPRQTWSWLITTAIIYVPGFLIQPDWLVQWLSAPRPLFERALAGFLPRTLQYIIPSQSLWYWLTLILLAVILLIIVRRLNQGRISFDLLILWGFIVNPLVHDYDLIQLIPLIQKKRTMILACLLSIPGWLVILFFYQVDHAWYVFTLIAPGLMLWYLLRKRSGSPQMDTSENPVNEFPDVVDL